MKTLPYTIVRSRRKTIALIVNSEAQLVVRAPYRVSEEEIDSLVKSKERWIVQKQQQIAAFDQKHSEILAVDGGRVLYLGNSYTMQRGAYAHIAVEGAFLLVPLQCATADIVVWLKQQALRVVTERTLFYADRMGVACSAIKLSNAKTRWGSCSAKNRLRFAWRLVMCPAAVIDYVVVHELGHILYKNHSAAFWAYVKAVLPNYQAQRAWLKQNRKLMDMM